MPRDVKPHEEIVVSNHESVEDVTQDFTKDLFKSFAKKTSLREVLWKYPENILKFFFSTQPLISILFFALVGVWFFTLITSLNVVEILAESRTNSIVIGQVGSLDVLNPLYTSSNTTVKDIRRLVFQELIGLDKNGSPVADIAKSWSLSEDKKTYQFNLRNDIKFSDGVKLTAEDVAFTINTAMNLAKLKDVDTVGQAFEDMKVEVVDAYTIRFTLAETNATFWEAVSVYIIPKHVYADVSLDKMYTAVQSQLPIGSGIYKINDIKESIVYLQASPYSIVKPNISFITIRIFPSVDALHVSYLNNQLDIVSNLGSYSAEGFVPGEHFTRLSAILPLRKKLIYLNMRETLLSKELVRKSLDLLLDKSKMLADTGIDAGLVQGPISDFSWAFNTQLKYVNYSPTLATTYLKDAGYTKNVQSGFFEDKDGKILSLTLTFLDNDVNQHVANEIATLYKKEGVMVNLDGQDFETLTKETVATRSFQMLLYEIETTIDPDQYNLWHSLKVDYPDLNLAGYKYSRVDVLLERSRKQMDRDKREVDYVAFQKYLMADMPVIFLYQPKFDIYISKRLNGISLVGLLKQSDWLDSVAEWSFSR